MADPLSVAASVAGLITIAETVIGNGYQYLKDTKGAGSQVAALISEVTNLFGVLHSLHLVACRFEGEKFDSTMQIHHIHSCYAVLEKIQARLDKSNPAKSHNPLEATKRRLHWPLSSSETKSLIADVERHKSTLSLALSADGMTALLLALARQDTVAKGVAELRSDLQKRRAQQARIALNEERQKILGFLGSADPKKNQETAIKLRQPGTGIWFTDGKEFKDWYSTKNAKLWLYGIPGAGKTILTSTIIQETQKLIDQSAGTDGLAYFYCDYKESSTQDPINILGSLIKQFAMQSEPALESVETFYKNHNPKGKPVIPPTAAELCTLLKSITTCFENALIIVDALDECVQDRYHVVELLRSLNLSGDSNIKTLFTSRREVDIEDHLSQYEQVAIAARSGDLKLYVASEIEQRIRRKQLRLRDPKLKEHIMERLIGGAEGMFRWVACQMDYLCELNNDAARRKALMSLPPTLFATYERILERVNASNEGNKILVQRVLRWIICAKTPLSTEALLEAISINEGDESLDRDSITEEGEILKWCSSLVRRRSDSSGIELSHFTVKEFLLTIDPIQNSNFTRYRVQPEGGDVELGRVCLTYLCLKHFATDARKDEHYGSPRNAEFPFWKYAAKHWDDHVYDHLEDDIIVRLSRILFAPSKNHQFLRWTQSVLKDLGDYNVTELNIANTTPLHWASSLALAELCQWLLKQGCDVNKSSIFGPALQCALLGRVNLCEAEIDFYEATVDPKWRDLARVRTVETLLNAGANLEFRSDQRHSLSPLGVALRTEDEDHARLLLEAGAVLDIDCISYMQSDDGYDDNDDDDDSSGYFKFWWLLELVTEKNIPEEVRSEFIKLGLEFEGSRERAIVLLEKEAPLGKIAGDQMTDYGPSLWDAASFGQDQVVSKLLCHVGLDIDATNGEDGNTALHYASENGHLEVVRVLIERGAGIDGRNKRGETPSHLAIANAHSLQVLQYLEEMGADLEMTNGNEETHLHLAAAGHNLKIVQYLVESRRDATDQVKRTSDGRTLLCAAGSGSFEATQYFIAKSCEVDINARSSDGRSCLHFAASSGNVDLVKLLLAKGISIDEVAEDGSTALHYAADAPTDCLDVPRFLLKGGANPSISRSDGYLPIHLIARNPSWKARAGLDLLASMGDGRASLNAKSKAGYNR